MADDLRTNLNFEDINHGLARFRDNVILKSREESRKIISTCIEKVILPVLTKIGEIEKRFHCSVPSSMNASYFEGLKVSAKNEFELMVNLDHLTAFKSFDDLGNRESKYACYGYLLCKHSYHNLSDVVVSPPPNCKHDKDDQVISALKVRKHFAELASQACSHIKCDEGLQVEAQFRDPYTVLKITMDDKAYYFELVPSLPFVNAWPPSAEDFGVRTNEWLTTDDVREIKQMGYSVIPMICPADPKNEALWRISFSKAEKYVMRYEDFGDPRGRRKQCSSFLKTIREANKEAMRPLVSYHLKTLVLNDCMKWPKDESWTHELLSQRFVGLLWHLDDALERRKLPHFFIKKCNLLAPYDMVDLQELATKVKDIFNDIVVNPLTSSQLNIKQGH
ncbi:putative nucleotidyltransferase MAB21L1 [Lingula anatina]|uniref:Nucleotidyltransferase MAB21L1 n=1 Tax=Lingula anatina TaxID=7574 RepID=A0A1S3JI83_LINAN|nr:putative nucleotidyltransferase MAB21L1 [Lingula anatina]|eukprot:XP_013409851.1 putative nucleotidyltransferase MAB21L1 [Lingula anatina]